MPSMKHALIVGTAVVALVLASAASAQVIPPGGSQFNPPLPPPPPPQLDALPQPNYAPPPGPSFGERISKCLDDAAASGLGPSERAAYSRNCANR